MSARVVIGLDDGADWPLLKSQILALGVQHLSDPTSYQPDVVVATLPADGEAGAFLAGVKLLPGVRYAEPDAFSSTC